MSDLYHKTIPLMFKGSVLVIIILGNSTLLPDLANVIACIGKTEAACKNLLWTFQLSGHKPSLPVMLYATFEMEELAQWHPWLN